MDIQQIQRQLDALKAKRTALTAELHAAKAKTQPQIDPEGDIDAAMREFAEWTQRERALTLLISAVDAQLIPTQAALREAKKAEQAVQLAEVEKEMQPAARGVIDAFLNFAEALDGFGIVCRAVRALGGAPHSQLVWADLRKAMLKQRDKLEADGWLPEEVRAMLPRNTAFLRNYRP